MPRRLTSILVVIFTLLLGYFAETINSDGKLPVYGVTFPLN